MDDFSGEWNGLVSNCCFVTFLGATISRTDAPYVQFKMAGLTIAIGGNDARFAYKSIIATDILNDNRVLKVVDVGHGAETDKTAYPSPCHCSY